MSTNIGSFIPTNYKCNSCDYVTCSKKDYTKHVMTRKHKSATNQQPNSNQKILYVCDHCNKEYRDRSGLWRHKQKCEHKEGMEHDIKAIAPVAHVAPVNPIDHASLTEKMIELVLSKNHEFMNIFMEKIVDILPSVTNNTNSHNTTNNQFNVQMFLNEHCKNAMNLKDFIETLPITDATYDSTIENGLTKTITNMITNGLSKLDVLERPIHCTDATRKTLYVKEENVWEKDTELLKVVAGITNLIRKKRTFISRWKEANDGWDTIERKQIKFTELVCNLMTDIEYDEKETGKIVRSISKTVYLDSEDKKKYIC